MAWFSLRVREVPGSTPGQAPFYAFLEVPILQSNNTNRKIKPQYKNEIIIKETVKHTSNIRNIFTQIMQDFGSYIENGSPASLITKRLWDNSIICFLSYWSFEMTPCNEIAFDGGDRKPNLEARCFYFVVVCQTKKAGNWSSSNVTVRSLLKPWNHQFYQTNLLIWSDSEFSYSSFFLQDLCLPCNAI